MVGDKASGLNGFSMASFQTCLEVIKEDGVRVFHEFHDNGLFEKRLNATFIALIPKQPSAVEVKNYCL